MSVLIDNNYGCILEYREIDSWGKLYIGSKIVDATFDYYEIERIDKDSGRDPHDLKDMIKLIFLASIEKIDSSIVIREKAKRDKYYKLFCNKIKPSDRSIRDYKKIYKAIHHIILKFSLILAKRLNISSFNHISVDGTIKLACNSPFNILKRKDLHLLLKHYMVEELSKKEIKQLRKVAKKFLFDKTISDERKVEMIYEWHDKLDLTGQSSIALYDVDARLMKIKDKGQLYKKWAYNIQLAVDTESKLICGVNVVQNPTDHYQMPAILEQTINNLGIKPSIVSADNIYGTLSNLFYLKEQGISARIPTREQNKEDKENSDDNPYGKDKFFFDEIRDVFICPEKQELTVDGVYDAPTQKGGFNKKKIVYSNHLACKNCPHKSKCTKAEHRTITRYVHTLSYEVEKIIDTPEGKKDYSKRVSTVEPPNGTFKRVFKYDFLQTVGLEMVQGYMFKISAAYNIIRIYNIMFDNKWDIFELGEFINIVGSKNEEVVFD